ncbi:MAG TPA: hypothetical protein VLJ42_10420 [Solirubrobacteraceae bacterium]|nr:hypothetical protein [Solirubrobacteraceae bacterium]
MPTTCFEWFNYSLWLVESMTPAFAVIVAVFGARSWRAQQRATKRAEVAGQAHVATLRLCDALEHVISPWSTNLPTPQPPVAPGGAPEEPEIARREHRAQVMEKEIEQRWIQIQAHETSFRIAWELTMVYVPDAVATLSAIWSKRMDIWSNQLNAADAIRYGWEAEPFAVEAKKKGFANQTLRSELNVLCNAAVTTLGPLARME